MAAEPLRIGSARSRCEIAKKGRHQLLVLRRMLANGVLGIAAFGRGIDEGAAVKVGLPEPGVERVEHCKETLDGIRRRSFDRVAKPLSPRLVAGVEERGDEAILGAEMEVETLPGGARLRQYRIDPGRVNAVAIEKPRGRGKNCLLRVSLTHKI